MAMVNRNFGEKNPTEAGGAGQDDVSAPWARDKKAHRFNGGRASSKHIFWVAGYAGSAQQDLELFLEVALFVMPRLIGNVVHDRALVGGADAKGAVALLPRKCRSVFVHPTRAVAF